MKYLLFIFLFLGCTRNNNATETETGESVACDELKARVDSLNKKLFIANFKLQRVQYYLDIAQKNPSQTKFLKGWINRAIDSADAK